MRYDTPVYFQHYPKKEYNVETGDYERANPIEVLCYANVTDARSTSLAIEFGKIKEGSLVLRVQGNYPNAPHSIRIGDKRYMVDACRTLRNKQTFIVSEVQ